MPKTAANDADRRVTASAAARKSEKQEASAGGKTPRKPHVSVAFNPTDIVVGRRMRQRRVLIGMSQEKLADALGITFQQVQKYEAGANRISASRLLQVSRTLGVTVDFFFQEAPGEEDLAAIEIPQLKTRETLDFLRVYYAIREPEPREAFAQLVKTIGARYKKVREPA